MPSTRMQLTRGLRARLAYASFKATHNVISVSLPELESLQLGEAAAYNHAFANHANNSNYAYGGRYHPTATSTRTNYYDNPATQGNSAMIPASASHSSLTPLGATGSTATATPSHRRGSMAPPTAIPTARGSFGQSSSTSGGTSGHQSLYASILTLPPAKRARTIHNPEDPPVPAPKKMNNGGGGGPGTPTHHGPQSSTSRHHRRRGSEQSTSGAPLTRTGSGSGAFSSVAERTRGAQSSRTKPASSSNKTPSSSKRKKTSSSSTHKESSSRKSKGKDRERDSHHSHSRKRQRAEYEMDLGGDVDTYDPMDLDMKAAATLTHLLRNSRSSFQSQSSVGAPSTVVSGAGALSPRSSISAGSDVGSSISQHFAQSSTRTTSHPNPTAANAAVDPSSSSFTSQASAAALMPATSSTRLRTPPMGNQTQGHTQAHAHDHQGSLTPKASSSVSVSASASAAHVGGGGGGVDGSGGTDGRAPSFPPDQVDQEALNLLTFFHTSPSPARPNTTRNRETQDAAAFRAFTRSISGGSGSGSELRAKGRVLFPETGSGLGAGSAANIGEIIGANTGTSSGGGTGGLAQRMLVRDNSGSAATLVGESIGGTPGRSRLGSATMIADETTSPTSGEDGSEGKVTPTQLLYKAHLNAKTGSENEKSQSQQEESAVAAVLQATQLLPPPPSPSRASLAVAPPSPSPSAVDVTSQPQASQPPGTPPKQTVGGMGSAFAGGGFGSFNMHDFINVSPSPGFVASSRFARTGREGSVGTLSGLRADVGRKLFEG